MNDSRKIKKNNIKTSVEDRHHVDADMDTNFHVDDSDPDPQN
jgi:hypothetical protein